MAECFISRRGGLSGDTDLITAEANDVLQTKDFMGPDGEIHPGTMVDDSDKGLSADAVAGNDRIEVKVPEVAKYNLGSRLYVAFTKIRSLIGYTDTSKVLKGTTIAGLQGTMPDNGAKTATLAAGESYRIPAGYHNGNGMVTATGMESQTPGTAGLYDIVAPKTAWVNGELVEGLLTDKIGTSQEVTTPTLNTANETLQMKIPYYGRYNDTSIVYATYAKIRSLIGLTAGKIAHGNTILGLTGTYKGLGTVTKDKVLAGETFSTSTLSNESGTMPNRGAVSRSLLAGSEYTIPAGYHNGEGVIAAMPLSDQTALVKEEFDITSDKIVKNASIAGVYGSAQRKKNITGLVESFDCGETIMEYSGEQPLVRQLPEGFNINDQITFVLKISNTCDGNTNSEFICVNTLSGSVVMPIVARGGTHLANMTINTYESNGIPKIMFTVTNKQVKAFTLKLETKAIMDGIFT